MQVKICIVRFWNIISILFSTIQGLAVPTYIVYKNCQKKNNNYIFQWNFRRLPSFFLYVLRFLLKEKASIFAYIFHHRRSAFCSNTILLVACFLLSLLLGRGWNVAARFIYILDLQFAALLCKSFAMTKSS